MIRFACHRDAAQLADIYRPYVENTTYTFEYTSPDAEEFCRRMDEMQKAFPYLVYEENGRVLGYAYGHRFAARAAYDWVCEVSIYIRQDAHGKGIGRALYSKLLELLKKQGYLKAYAIITESNSPSLAFHHAMGFETLATFPRQGYKAGQWLGVTYCVLSLNEMKIPPNPIRPCPKTPD